MLESFAPWRPTSVWAAVAKTGRGGAPGNMGIRIKLVETGSILSIAAKAGRRDELARLFQSRFGGELPASGRLTRGRDCDLVWSAPDQWLAVSEKPFDSELLRSIGEIATVTDQGSSRALIEVSGGDARDALAKGFAIDLHPDVFAPGRTAVTSVAHMSVQIWQRNAEHYTVAVPRSFAAGFWSWLISAASAYGYEVVP